MGMTHRPDLLATLARILRAAADECDAISRELAVEQFDWISQAESPIGRRRHCAAVRARMSRGLPGACTVGRRHLLSPEALREVLVGYGRPVPPAESDVVRELRRRLRQVGGDL